MKKYYVYLDESGKFEDNSSTDNRRNPSLVGGFFYEKSMLNFNGFENKIQKCIYECGTHATEISNDEKGANTYKMLSTAKSQKYPIEFVIFQNDVKKKIINSTETYLTVITEGLVQLLKTLTIIENDSIELNVVAGFKKDTTQPVTNSTVQGYIPLISYKENLMIKIAIEKAKLRNDNVQKSTINIELKDDKKNTLLILCDYICNFWYTRQSKAFSEYMNFNGKNIKIREALKAYYKEDFVFPLFSTEENEHVIRMISDGFYADALFEVCANMLTNSNCNKIKNSFIKLRKKQMYRQLDNLADYIGDIIIFKQPNNLIEKVLNNALELYNYLIENGFNSRKFYLDIMLYYLAYLNQNFQPEKMESIFKSLEADIAKYTIQTLDTDYLFIYYTRWAVYLLDKHNYDESCKICENMELLLNIIEEDMRKNDLLKLEGECKSEQLGKILGTKLQAQIYQCYKDKTIYDKAKETSDKAISQFTFTYDLKRQYQYRAELEAVYGNFSEAIRWLSLSFDGMDWKQKISSTDKDIFDIYNLLFVSALTRKINPEISATISNQIRQNNTCMNDIQKNGSLKNICLFYMGYSMLGDSKLDNIGKSILTKIVNNSLDKNSIEVKAAVVSLDNGEGLDVIFD